MRLTRSDFVDVCNALSRQQAAAAAAGPHRTGEKRGGVRMAVEREVSVTPVAADGKAGPPFKALARDISFAGLALLSRHPVPPNGLLVVRLPRKDKEPLSMLCRAVHVRELAEDIHAIGTEFVNQTAAPPGGAGA